MTFCASDARFADFGSSPPAGRGAITTASLLIVCTIGGALSYNDAGAGGAEGHRAMELALIFAFGNSFFVEGAVHEALMVCGDTGGEEL